MFKALTYPGLVGAGLVVAGLVGCTPGVGEGLQKENDILLLYF